MLQCNERLYECHNEEEEQQKTAKKEKGSKKVLRPLDVSLGVPKPIQG